MPVSAPAPASSVETRQAASQSSVREAARERGPRRKSQPVPNRSTKNLGDFQRSLLRWYDRHRRDLPWRGTRDPYRIWLSEIMLQQTRVAAVLEHYRLFLKRFPNVRALAATSQNKVLAAWSGLGYYRRARMLRECAKEIVKQHGGQFPKTADSLRTLPGIGRYTAAAIASIAFAEPVAVVDGNVERVLHRLTSRSLSTKQTWHQAQSLLSESRPGDHNQAMMELGATLCTPRQPKCDLCPIRKWCSTQGEAPRITPTKRQCRKEMGCALDQRDGHIRLVQRPFSSSLMAGMWELPTPPEAPHSARDSGSARQIAANGRKSAASAIPWRSFRHSITVTDYTVHVFRAAASSTKGKWIPIARLSEFPITGLTRKILKAAGII